MKSETSCNPTAAVIRENLKRFWAIDLFSLLLLLFSSVIIAAVVSKSHAQAVKLVNSFYTNLNPGYLLAFILLSAGAGASCFRYLHSSSEASFMHSLPISRRNLFAASFISGLVLIIVPVLITGTVNMLYTMSFVHLRWILTSLVICLFIYSVSVLSAVISGNMIMSLSNLVVLVHLIPGLLLLADGYCSVFLYGFDGTYLGKVMSRFYVFTAIAGKTSWTPVVCYLLASAAVIALALYAYRKRPMEKTGESLVFPGLYGCYLIMSEFVCAALFGLVFYSLFSDASKALETMMFAVFALFGLLIAYIPANLLLHRDFSLFEKKKILPALAGYGLAILCMFMSLGFSGAYALRVPNKPEGCALSVGGALLYDAACYRGSVDEMVCLKDKENIRRLENIQKQLYEERKNGSGELFIKIAYRTKNGKLMRRSYSNVNRAQYKKIKRELNAVFESSEYRSFFRCRNLVYPVVSAEIYNESTDRNIKISEKRDLEALQKALDKDLLAVPGKVFTDAESQDTYLTVTLEMKDKTGKKKTEETLYLPKDYKNTIKWFNIFKQDG